MKLHHPNCQSNNCIVCLKDHRALEHILWKKIGMNTSIHDVLYEYRSWLDRHKIPSHTEWGWASVETFRDSNIEQFCIWFKENYS